MIFIVVPVNGKVRLDITLDGEEIYCVYWVVHSKQYVREIRNGL